MIALAIDDDVVSRMALVDLLSAFSSLQIEEAEDGEAAWQRLQAAPCPVICCCDIRMPRLSGIELLGRMKANPRLADVPLILVSSASDRETVVEANRLGAAGYILKPFRSEESRERLKLILNRTVDSWAEKPALTIRRLNINPARLAAYLAAFHEQLVNARGKFESPDPNNAAAEARLDRLYTSCVTLGQWRGASLVDRIRHRQIGTAEWNVLLADIQVLIENQQAALALACNMA